MGVNELDFFWIIIIIFIIYFSEMKSAFLFALLSLLPHFLFAASRYYVAETGNDSNDGLSWQTAFAGVQKAIDAAAAAATEESPSEVWVAAGTYKHGSPMAMKNNVLIYGGFAGTETELSERDFLKNISVLSGEDSYQIFVNAYTAESPLTGSASLDGFRLEGGKSDSFGGAMQNTHSSPLVSNCVFIGNKTTAPFSKFSAGGAVSNLNSSPIFRSCVFAENKCEQTYGSSSIYPGIFFPAGMGDDFSIYPIETEDAPILIQDTELNEDFVFSNDSFNSTFYFSAGGAIYSASKSSPAFLFCAFYDNYATSVNSILLSESECEIVNCTFYTKTSYKGIEMRAADISASDSSSLKIANSIFYQTSPSDSIFQSGDSQVLAHNCIMSVPYAGEKISGDSPRLMAYGNYAGYPFKFTPLKCDSPAIGAGLSQAALKEKGFKATLLKFDLLQNPVAENPAIGAFEYVPNLAGEIMAQNGLKYAAGSTASLSMECSSEEYIVQYFKDGIPYAEEFSWSGCELPMEFEISETASYSAKLTFPDGTSVQTPTVTLEALPAVVYLSPAGNDLNDGYSWQNAKATFGAALSACAYGATIKMNRGVYKTSPDGYIGAKGIRVCGGFDAAGPDSQNPSNRSIISFPLSLVGAWLEFDAVTFTGNNKLYFEESTLAFSNCSFQDISIESFNSEASYEKCSFYRCGGASIKSPISHSSTSARFANCTFQENLGRDSAAIYSYNSSDVSIIHCTFLNNALSSNGAYNAVLNSSASRATVVNSAFYSIYSSNSSHIQSDSSSLETMLSNALLGASDFSGAFYFRANYGGFADICIYQGAAGISQEDARTFVPEIELPSNDALGIPYTSDNRLIGAVSKGKFLGIYLDDYKDEYSVPLVVLRPNSKFAKDCLLPIRLCCNMELSSQASIKWYKDGAQIEGVLPAIDVAQPEDTASYRAEITDGAEVFSTPELEVSTCPSIIRVSPGGDDSNDGATWESAKRTISAAFEDAGVCTRIWIAEGSYEECGFKLLQAMEVYGGFRGTENNLQERTSGARTIISADASPAFDNNYSSTCPLASALIQDICFEDSKQDVVRNFFANVSILNCTFKNNLCENGAIYNYQSAPYIANCSFFNNKSTSDFLFATSEVSAAPLTTSLLSEGSTTIINPDFYRYTDDIYSVGGAPCIVNCTFVRAQPSSSHYQVYSSSADSILANCLFCGSETSYKSPNCANNAVYSGPTPVPADNGGFADTFAVEFGTNAISAGISQDQVQYPIPTSDARGVARAKKSTIGAYEYVPQAGYETWAAKNDLFGTETAPAAITQNDGITNVEKYAFGLPCDKPATYFDNPLFSVSVSHPAQTMAADNSSSAESVMTMKYPVNASADDISVKAYKSHDLLEWLPAESKFDGFSGCYNLFRVDETIPRGGKVFFKLVLE